MVSKYVARKIADNKSGSLYTAIKRLMDICNDRNATSITFRAKDVELNGNVLSNLAKIGVVDIVAKEDYWYQIDEDTMRRGEINIYRFKVTDIDPIIFDEVRQIKVDRVEQRIERLKASLAKAYEDLDKI